MRDDKMICTGYPSKVIHLNVQLVIMMMNLFCYLSEVDTIQDVISKFMEMMVIKIFQP